MPDSGKQKIYTRDELLELNDNERFLYIAEMFQQILSSISKLNVAETYGAGNRTCRREDNNYEEILRIRTIFPFSSVASFQRFNDDIIKNEENFAILLKLYLKRVGGSDGHRIVRAILGEIMTDELAMMYNFKGRNKKLAFEKLSINSMISDIATELDVLFTVQDASNATKHWLKQATKRVTHKDSRKKALEKATQEKENDEGM